MIDIRTDSYKDIFNFAHDFVVKQGHASISRDGGCFYNGPGGTHCAIGAMLPEGVVGEGNTILDLVEVAKEGTTSTH